MKFLPERLRDIRILKGYTVEYVASQLGVTKQAVSKYETGRMIPSSDVLNRIADFFSLPQSYLTKEEMLPDKRSLIFYRKNNRTPNREIEEAQVTLKWFYEMIDACNEYITPLRIPDLSEKMTIEEKAYAVRKFWNIGEQPIEDLSFLLKNNGFYIFTTKMGNDKIDGYSQLIGEYPIIVLNESRGNKERKNFSLAHELAHLILHVNSTTESDESMEKQADLFAACFLMPETEFSKEVVRKDADAFIALGERWHVSPQAAVERCDRLGLSEGNQEVKRAHKEYLLQRLNKRKDYFIPEENHVCGLAEIFETIDSDAEKRDAFMRRLCFPVSEVQRLCHMDTVFEACNVKKEENAADMDGVQLSFVF